MSDSQPGEPLQPAVTAGGLLRQARVAKGLHIAALATSIKVAPRKLELLESDRFEELPGATFTRALAQTVCRSLKIDAAPVLALLPLPADQSLSQMGLGLNAPFRDRPGRRVPSDLQFMKSPIVIGIGILLVGSALLYLLPAGWISEVTHGGLTSTEPAVVSPVVVSSPGLTSAPAVVVTTLPVPVPAASTVVETVQVASAPAAGASQPPPAAPAASPAQGVLLLRASAESWVEVIDGRGAPLLSRMLQPGESIGLDGASPLRVRIGNASATQVSFKGKNVELVPTRDNVAKLELR
ncbi:MAG: helix-turn-helix domain-containing protein [Cytophagales bacterium]|nr:helix-turn-helix domain-containing protein [Rhizobacter sp.]